MEKKNNRKKNTPRLIQTEIRIFPYIKQKLEFSMQIL